MVLYSAGIFHPCKRYKTKNGQETGEFVFRNQVYCSSIEWCIFWWRSLCTVPLVLQKFSAGLCLSGIPCRVVKNFVIIWSLDPRTCSKRFRFWVNCINCSPVHQKYQGSIIHSHLWQVLQVNGPIDSPAMQLLQKNTLTPNMTGHDTLKCDLKVTFSERKYLQKECH